MPRKSTQIAEQLQFPMTPPTECPLGESAPYRRHIFQQDPVFLPSYVRKNGLLFTGDSLEWLKTIQDDTIDLIFAAPPITSKRQTGTSLNPRRPISSGPCNGSPRPPAF